MRGRKPKPRPADVAAIASVPSPPKWLSDSGKAEWRRVAKHLVDRRVLAETDLALLAAFCSAVGVIRDGNEVIRDQGMMIGDKAHPMIGKINAAALTVARIGAELGLSPIARAKVGQTPEEQDAAEWASMGLD